MLARFLNCTPAEYHADPCEVPSLSSSCARTIVTRSPAHAWVEHPKLGALVWPSTRPQDEGSIIHSLLLGKGAEIDVLDYPDFKTMRAREDRDNAIAAGRIPIVASKFGPLEQAAAALRTRIADILGVTFDTSFGTAEIAIEYDEEGAAGPVRCRSMLDFLTHDGATIYDVKKIKSADPKTRSRHAYEYGYDIQHAAYTSAVAKLKPELAGRIDFVWIFAELEPPYAVVPARADGQLRELGAYRWQRGIEIWERCLKSGRWPAYTETIDVLEAPKWALYDELGANLDG